MDRLILDSPAKINLYLRVLNKREDGYHQVETLIQAVDLCDRLTLTKSAGNISVSSDSPDLPLARDNLAYKAADLLVKELAINKGVRIFIEKKIPVAAGLGGGSSDAASVLLGLNQLWDLKLDSEVLMEFGRKLGTDVPFFISRHQTALAFGRGDRIFPSVTDKIKWYCLIMPPGKLSTKKIYGKLDFLRKRDANLTFKSGDVKMLIPHNDLAQAVIEELPVVGEIIDLMGSMGFKAMVSGSGPAVYVLASDRKEAIKTAQQIAAQNRWTTYVIQTYNRRKQSGNNRG
ncbi:MAG: 4-(cytidine 5'-diphospho)-2-C-methyl-D-erythritol kinase [Candidatus Omnitrophota bacterium]|nr:4-(cytidine 5'-diphospho)-2-C-methyl-D-erythritol kinase [Candidatus Omnitrophota bacterium]